MMNQPASPHRQLPLVLLLQLGAVEVAVPGVGVREVEAVPALALVAPAPEPKSWERHTLQGKDERIFIILLQFLLYTFFYTFISISKFFTSVCI